MTDKPGNDQASQPTPGGVVPADALAEAEAAVAKIKDNVRDSMVHVGREHSGLLTPPLTPRYRRRPRL